MQKLAKFILTRSLRSNPQLAGTATITAAAAVGSLYSQSIFTLIRASSPIMGRWFGSTSEILSSLVLSLGIQPIKDIFPKLLKAIIIAKAVRIAVLTGFVIPLRAIFGEWFLLLVTPDSWHYTIKSVGSITIPFVELFNTYLNNALSAASSLPAFNIPLWIQIFGAISVVFSTLSWYLGYGEQLQSTLRFFAYLITRLPQTAAMELYSIWADPISDTLRIIKEWKLSSYSLKGIKWISSYWNSTNTVWSIIRSPVDFVIKYSWKGIRFGWRKLGTVFEWLTKYGS
jgi:hypothetical protein